MNNARYIIQVSGNGSGDITHQVGPLIPPPRATDEDAGMEIRRLWRQWRQNVPEPDSDDEFLDYANQHGWIVPAEQTIFIPV